MQSQFNNFECYQDLKSTVITIFASPLTLHPPHLQPLSLSSLSNHYSNYIFKYIRFPCSLSKNLDKTPKIIKIHIPTFLYLLPRFIYWTRVLENTQPYTDFIFISQTSHGISMLIASRFTFA